MEVDRENLEQEKKGGFKGVFVWEAVFEGGGEVRRQANFFVLIIYSYPQMNVRGGGMPFFSVGYFFIRGSKFACVIIFIFFMEEDFQPENLPSNFHCAINISKFFAEINFARTQPKKYADKIRDTMKNFIEDKLIKFQGTRVTAI